MGTKQNPPQVERVKRRKTKKTSYCSIRKIMAKPGKKEEFGARRERLQGTKEGGGPVTTRIGLTIRVKNRKILEEGRRR